MRYIGDGGVFAGVDAVRERMEKRLAESPPGMGSWAAVDRLSGEIHGAVILQPLPDNDGNRTADIEVGWHLRVASWGKGLAVEAARPIIAHGFDDLGLAEIFAIVLAENAASIRVTQKLGMEPLGLTDRYYNVKALLFRLVNPSR